LSKLDVVFLRLVLERSDPGCMFENGLTEGRINEGFFEWRSDAFEGTPSPVDRRLHSASHRRRLKVQHDDHAKKEQY